MSYLLALDQGTTSSRAIAFDTQGAVLALAQRPLTQHFPQPGWVEHDAREIWASQLEVAREVIARLGGKAPAAIGITNQRETVVVWDRATGEPVAPAIVWQDRRTVAQCLELARSSQATPIETKTGLVIDAYFSATKWQWLLETQPELRHRAQAGELAFGTVDSWLVWKLTAGACHVTDASNASRTMLYDLESAQWDEALLSVFGIPRGVLPRIVDSSGYIGETRPGLLHEEALPIAGIAGDQQAATFGQACHQPGQAKLTYGTGCFLLACAGPRVVRSQHRLLATVGWQRAGERRYCLEGGVFMGGATVQWLRDGLGIIDSAETIEPLARSVPDTGDVWLVPAFTGLGAPHWDGQARGLLIGLTRGTTRAHIARAALQSIALQSAELVSTMNRDLPTPIRSLRVDGGACRNDLLMQMQADFSDIVIERPANPETTALGAALLAGLAIGIYPSEESLAERWQAQRRFEPQLSDAKREAMLQRWQEAAERSRRWANA